MKKITRKLAYLSLASIMSASCSLPTFNSSNPSSKINTINSVNKTSVNATNKSFKTKANVQTCSGFNELAYLVAFPDVDAEVKKGTFHSGLEHYIKIGKNEGKANNAKYQELRASINDAVEVDGFNELAYLIAFPDVDEALKKGLYFLHSGLDHYVKVGKNENRGNNSSYQGLKINIDNAVNVDSFNELAYLVAFPDVDQAIKNGSSSLHSGLEHYIRTGKSEGRGNNSNYQVLRNNINYAVNVDSFNELAYLLAFPDVDQAIKKGLYSLHSGLDHYVKAGKNESRDNNSNYQELRNDINNAVTGSVALSPALSKFVILASETVTNAGPSEVTGDLGLSPGTAVVGFDVPSGPGILKGSKHAGNPTAAQAKLDLTTAYNDALSRTCALITVSGNLGGKTLAPGLYNSQTSLEISSGDLTLDAQGNSNAVWVFQMGSTLTTTPGRKIIMSGGAKANNVFWQVGSSATFGTTSVFKGNILAAVSITMNNGSSLEGRALAQTGAVSLDSSTVTKPSI